jgi:hypothetical protein
MCGKHFVKSTADFERKKRPQSAPKTTPKRPPFDAFFTPAPTSLTPFLTAKRGQIARSQSRFVSAAVCKDMQFLPFADLVNTIA